MCALGSLLRTMCEDVHLAFAAAWCGVTDKRARVGIEWLRDRGYLVKVGREQFGPANHWANLYALGASHPLDEEEAAWPSRLAAAYEYERQQADEADELGPEAA